MHLKTIRFKAVIGNPFYLFAIVLFLTFTLYMLGWSNLFPPVKGSFIAFIVLSLGLFITLGYFVKERLANMNLSIVARPSNSFLYIATAVSLMVFIFEFIINGKIPFFDILFKTTYSNYRDFYSIPYLHTLASTCGVFLISILFGLLIDKWNWRYMLLLALNMLPYIILFSRSIVIIIIIQCFFYTALRVKRLKVKHILLFISLAVLIAYAFGVVGNYREKAKERGTGGPNFVSVSQLNSKYPSFLPYEFAWSYMYAASPIANLQHNIIKSSPVTTDFKGLIVSEFLPSRAKLLLSQYLHLKERKTAKIKSSFTAGTIFSGVYSYAGWWGISLMVIIIISINFIVVYFLSFNSPYSLITLTFLFSFTVLNFFENMISFTPMFLLLILGVGFHIYSVIKSQNIK